jgi:hypothetical protein
MPCWRPTPHPITAEVMTYRDSTSAVVAVHQKRAGKPFCDSAGQVAVSSKPIAGAMDGLYLEHISAEPLQWNTSSVRSIVLPNSFGRPEYKDNLSVDSFTSQRMVSN